MHVPFYWNYYDVRTDRQALNNMEALIYHCGMFMLDSQAVMFLLKHLHAGANISLKHIHVGNNLSLQYLCPGAKLSLPHLHANVAKLQTPDTIVLLQHEVKLINEGDISTVMDARTSQQ